TKATVCVFVRDWSRTKVYYHRLFKVPANSEHFTLQLPALNKLPLKGVATIAWLAADDMDAEFAFAGPTLKVDPHIPQVRPLEDLGVFSKPREVGFFMQIPNGTNDVRGFLTHLKTETPDGVSIAYDKRKMQVAPRAMTYFPYRPKLKNDGRYHLLLRVQTPDGGHTYRFDEYPFTIAPVHEDEDSPNGHVGVWMTGESYDEIQAAAMAGAQWVCMDVEYTDLLASYRFRSRLRTIVNAAYRVKSRNMQVAIRVRMPDERVLPGANVMKQFAHDVTRRLYGLVDRWIIDTPDEGNDLAAVMAALILDAQQETTPAMVPFEGGYIPFGPGARTPEELMQGFLDEMQRIVEGTEATGASAEGMKTDIWPGRIIQQYSDAAATPEPTGDESETDTGIQTPDAGASPAWAITPSPPAAVTGDAAFAAMTREMAAALADGAQTVLWRSTDDAALLDDDGYATSAWLALRMFAQQIQEIETVEEIEIGDGCTALRFSGADHDVIVLWTDSGDAEIVLSGSAGEGELVRSSAQRSTVRWDPGNHSITIGTAPAYLVLDPGAEISITTATAPGL
ncbi:MAG: hypothetical protein ACLFWB_07330, partial [Armatimonadota bacterium]